MPTALDLPQELLCAPSQMDLDCSAPAQVKLTPPSRPCDPHPLLIPMSASAGESSWLLPAEHWFTRIFMCWYRFTSAWTLSARSQDATRLHRRCCLRSMLTSTSRGSQRYRREHRRPAFPVYPLSSLASSPLACRSSATWPDVQHDAAQRRRDPCVQLKKPLKEAAARKFGTGVPIIDRILEIEVGVDSVACGTLYKEMKVVHIANPHKRMRKARVSSLTADELDPYPHSTAPCCCTSDTANHS
jgi:hypothetical protein